MGGRFERDIARNEMGISRSFGEPLGRGMGKMAPWPHMGRVYSLGFRLPGLSLMSGLLFQVKSVGFP